ncbi:helix-turn-helix transcriptional regulator [Pedobacter riviphilus]|uniref:Helix-turn-helix transcriptional regulator n=1 Tax=Pedobacter riviphilus TaxID=2766984 RepID=A0ABX6TMS2_9SPHI|nr:MULTISPECIES: helix-turn-helix domain-containing protein [Pedobacter]NII83243.1 DNA-binding HxlR family transcriptional regulator [Pedobacter sp. SG908]NMN37113.1 DNA-binding HxlR family transcriptional regulator [Pedobacter sp. SG918]QNR86834.1 helix-turn-helix transcriptional regulator [Pedobacter riviphilus]
MASTNINGELKEATCEQELSAIRDSLEILGGKWKLRIMRYLVNRIDQRNTFKKIQREIEGISAKMLSKELHDLELNLLVSREVIDSKPVTVAYSITEYGYTVLPVTETLVEWGLRHREKIKAMINCFPA